MLFKESRCAATDASGFIFPDFSVVFSGQPTSNSQSSKDQYLANGNIEE